MPSDRTGPITYRIVIPALRRHPPIRRKGP